LGAKTCRNIAPESIETSRKLVSNGSLHFGEPDGVGGTRRRVLNWQLFLGKNSYGPC
jgi:hypothetical protein